MVSLDSNSATSKNFERVLLFLSNGITPEESIEEFRRVPLFNLLLFIGIVSFTLFAFITAISGHMLFATIELIISLILVGGYFATRKLGIPQWAGHSLLTLFFAFFILIGVNGGPGGTGYLWIYTFPLIASFLSGPRHGSLWALSLLTIILTTTLSFGNHPFVIEYEPSLIIRMSATYVISVIFSFMADGILLYTYRNMKEIKKKLEETILELNQSREELHQQAIQDGLTGIYNRRFFNQTITTWTLQAQRHNSATALFMIDVDKFKRYNDRFGHLKGDTILKTVATTIKKTLRRESDMVFRYGGEEFAVLLTKTTPETTYKLAEKIMNAVRRCNIPHPESPIGVISVSIGVTEWDPDCNSEIFPEDLIEKADAALYEAKERGRNQIVFRTIEGSEYHKQGTTFIPIVSAIEAS